MTKEEIKKMVYKANLPFHYSTGKPSLWHELKQFAKLVAEKEREECAKIADEWLVAYPHPSKTIAETIRARGQE